MTWPSGGDVFVNQNGPYTIARKEGTDPPSAANVPETVPAPPPRVVTVTQEFLSTRGVNIVQQGTPMISDPAEVVLQGQTPAGTSFVRNS